ncbi:MAG: acyl-CoA dehydrogenase family protein [Ilumatobacteraceae bacterium]
MAVDLVEAAEGVQELVEAHADKAEQQRRMPKRLVQALRDAQLFRMCVPAVYGGPEADPVTLVRAIEKIAIADGAAGWCTMIASTTSSMSMFMDPDYARAVYGDAKVITGGVYAPNGTAVRDGKGWRVTGRWQWGSGAQHCQFLTGGCRTTDGQFHLMFLDASDVTIHDTWYTSGLRGTGSNDFSVDGAYVPCGRSVQPESRLPTVDSPLAAFPNFSLLAAGVAAVSLGIARHALDEFTELAQAKTPQFGSRTLSQSGSTQAGLARAEGVLRSARAFLLDELAQAWDRACAGDPVDIATRARIRLACTHAATSAATATDVAYTLGGGTSVYETSPLQRCLRDVHVTTQHLMVSPRLNETLGRLFFGLDVATSTL